MGVWRILNIIKQYLASLGTLTCIHGQAVGCHWLAAHSHLHCYIFSQQIDLPEEKRPLGRPRRRWVDNIRMDLGEVGWGDVNWIGLAQDRTRWRALVNSVLKLRVP
jgi:hypothetical protein